jgi:hypothetical protein
MRRSAGGRRKRTRTRGNLAGGLPSGQSECAAEGDWNARSPTVNTDDPGRAAERRVLKIQTKLHRWAGDDPIGGSTTCSTLSPIARSSWWRGIARQRRERARLQLGPQPGQEQPLRSVQVTGTDPVDPGRAGRSRVSQLRPLPAAAVAQPRAASVKITHDMNQDPPSQVRCVGPGNRGSSSSRLRQVRSRLRISLRRQARYQSARTAR